MTTRTELPPPTAEEVLVKLQAELTALETRRTQTQREVEDVRFTHERRCAAYQHHPSCHD